LSELWDIYDKNGNKTTETTIRGEKLKPGNYHLVVHVWIINDKGNYLIQKRAEHLDLFPGIWAATGGSAISGEDSQTAAIRELHEELGIKANPKRMEKVKRIQRKDNFTDIWLIHQNINLDNVDLQEEEVSDVIWVDEVTIKEMIRNGCFYNYGKAYFKYIFD